MLAFYLVVKDEDVSTSYISRESFHHEQKDNTLRGEHNLLQSCVGFSSFSNDFGIEWKTPTLTVVQCELALSNEGKFLCACWFCGAKILLST